MAASSERGFNFPCFKDKVVLITGASSGIGEATAIAFAKDGAKLALTGRNAERLNGVVQRCISEGVKAENVLQMTGDIVDHEFIERFISQTVSNLGGIDVLVNNAGAAKGREPGEFKVDQLDGYLDLFIRAVYTFLQFSLPHLKKSKGNIINVSSTAASTNGSAGITHYDVSKSALNRMASSLAYELALDGIRINTVSPGIIRTPIFPIFCGGHDESEKLLTVLGNKTGFKRVGTPEETASTIQFLASPAASYITGVDLLVDRGITKYPILLPEELQKLSDP